jgi:hypothetical protein
MGVLWDGIVRKIWMAFFDGCFDGLSGLFKLTE